MSVGKRPRWRQSARWLFALILLGTTLGVSHLFLELIDDDARRPRQSGNDLVLVTTQLERTGWQLLDRLQRRGDGQALDPLRRLRRQLDQAAAGPVLTLPRAPRILAAAGSWLDKTEPRLALADIAADHSDVGQGLRDLLADLEQLTAAAHRFEQAERQRRQQRFSGFYHRALPLFALAMLSGGALLALGLRGQQRMNVLRKRLDNRIQNRTQELIGLRDLLANIVDAMPSALIGIDADGLISRWNREAENLTALPAVEVVGRPLAGLDSSLAGQTERVERAIVHGRPLPPERLQWTHRDGSRRTLEVTVYPLTRDGQGAVIRLDDISERVRLEETMIQSEKMLSVGSLAAGMAHEINNPLAGILQNAQVLRARLLDDNLANRRIAERCGSNLYALRNFLHQRQVPAMLDAVIESGQRAATIVSNMLSFSRRSDNSSRFLLCGLSELLDRTIEIAVSDYQAAQRYDFRRIRILRDYQPDMPAASCAPSEIQQVFLNLLRNCAQAMFDAQPADTRPQLNLRVCARQGVARVEIEDNGPGMNEQTRKRIFEPFFTTKEVGRGSGLGLSVSYFIVKEIHGGELHVRSSPGQGTTFVIELPLAQAQAA